MSEKLIPFVFDEFIKDPSRLRWPDGGEPDWADSVRNCVVAHWDGKRVVAYAGNEFHLLRLAAKTRIVRVRLYRARMEGNVEAITDEVCRNAKSGLDAPKTPSGFTWLCDPVEIEIQE